MSNANNEGLLAFTYLCEQLNAFGCAMGYICGYFVGAGGERLEWHKPMERARECLDFADMLTR